MFNSDCPELMPIVVWRRRLREMGCRNVNAALKFLIVIGIACLASFDAAAAAPKRIIVLQSNGQDFRPWSEYVKTFRQELERKWSSPLIVQNFPVLIASDSEETERRFVDYLNALSAGNPPDLIVAFGAPAAAF